MHDPLPLSSVVKCLLTFRSHSLDRFRAMPRSYFSTFLDIFQVPLNDRNKQFISPPDFIFACVLVAERAQAYYLFH